MAAPPLTQSWNLNLVSGLLLGTTRNSLVCTHTLGFSPQFWAYLGGMFKAFEFCLPTNATKVPPGRNGFTK
jgi:hypothetical protein